MKKLFLILFFAILSVAMVNGLGEAAVCSSCHTMHNSQNGADVNTNGPQPQLLKLDCVACHTAGAAQQVNTSTQAPRVLATGAPAGQGGSDTNAGGDFYWVNAGTDNLGHNVLDLPVSNPDTMTTPPGWDADATSGFSYGQVNGGGSSWTSQLTCAGTRGCHGNHTDVDSLTAMKGTHHNNGGSSYLNNTDAFASATTIGNSYRFLGGIKGFENHDWNWGETTSAHNEYIGVDDQSNREYNEANPDYATASAAGTISFMCAECHGVFHGNIANVDPQTASDPWRRHPTDIVLPGTAGTEYATYNPDSAGAYNLTVPVARGGTPSASSSTVTEGATNETGAIVMCLSCHRAHGSPVADLLRFTYNMDAGTTSTTDDGCFVCHTSKNGDTP